MKRKTHYLLVAVICAATVICSLVISTNLLQLGGKEGITVDDWLTLDLVHSDGSIDHTNHSWSRNVQPGDIILVHVPLREEWRTAGAALCFRMYNSSIKVLYGDEIRYSYGTEDILPGREIGHLEVCATVPKDGWGDEMIIRIDPTKYNSSFSISNVRLTDGSDARLSVLGRNSVDYLIFLAAAVMSLITTAIFLVLFITGRRGIRGLLLSLFLLTVSCWYLGFRGLFYVFSGNIPIAANIEYVTLYAVPIPFLGYIRREKLQPFAKKILLGMEILFAAIFIVMTCLYFSPSSITYITFMNPLRMLLIAALLITIFLVLKSPEDKGVLSVRVLRIGLVVTMAFGVLEVIRVSLSPTILASGHPTLIMLTDHTYFSQIMLICFLTTLLLNYMLREVEAIRAQAEKEQLAVLAYTDLLTGIPNRQDFEQKAERMTEEELKQCAVLFLDANDLKKANDEYGHVAGDKLLRVVGQSLAKACLKTRSFCARYGGDEFVACIINGDEAQAVEEQFRAYLEEANQRKELPFTATVACGRAAWKELDGNAAFNTLVDLADERMYKEKQRMKGSCR